MNVAQARDVARRWAIETLTSLDGVVGAFLHGSITWRADADPIPPASDVDLIVAVEPHADPIPTGKREVDGVLLDVSTIPEAEIVTPEEVLGRYHLASSFRVDGILHDPTGRLSDLQSQVGAAWYRRDWVTARSADARDKVLRAPLPAPHAPLEIQVIGWVFPAGVTTHVLLAAGTRNPTVRTRFVLCRDLLLRYAMPDLHERLLGLVGAQHLSAAEVTTMIDVLEPVYDEAASLPPSPVPFTGDIKPDTRHIAIDAARQLVSDGLHREAVFWIVVTWARCQVIRRHTGFNVDADLGWLRLLDTIGVDPGNLTASAEATHSAMPAVWDAALAIIAANPEITD